MFCFAVYGATHAINRAYGPLLKPLGLTYPQFITLTLLWENDAQGVGDLASQLGMESSTMTPLVKRLESYDYVERKRGSQDERQVFVHLTEKGRSLQKDAKHIVECMISETGMELSELESLVASLSKLKVNLTDARAS
jgi:DNA-binding MarR family transcriptional regulator